MKDLVLNNPLTFSDLTRSIEYWNHNTSILRTLTDPGRWYKPQFIQQLQFFIKKKPGSDKVLGEDRYKLIKIIEDRDLRHYHSKFESALTDIIVTKIRDALGIKEPIKLKSSDSLILYKNRNKPLGKGSYGEVFQTTFNGQEVVMKTFPEKVSENEFYSELAAAAFYLPANKYCANFLAYSAIPNAEFFIIELGTKGTLADKIVSKENDLSDINKLKISMALCEAVQFIQQNNMGHFDIKPQNVILNNNYEPKLIDFGCARFFTTNAMNSEEFKGNRPKGTAKFTAPEVMLAEADNKNHSFAYADVYSLAITLYCLSHNTADPYPNKDVNFIIFNVMNDKIRPEIQKENCPITTAAQKFWAHEPKQRQSLHDGIEFFSNEIKSPNSK